MEVLLSRWRGGACNARRRTVQTPEGVASNAPAELATSRGFQQNQTFKTQGSAALHSGPLRLRRVRSL